MGFGIEVAAAVALTFAAFAACVALCWCVKVIHDAWERWSDWR